MTKANLIRVGLILAFAITLGLIIELMGLRENFSLEYLKATIEANLLVGIAIFIGMFALGNLIHIPGWIFMAAALLTLGKVGGGLLTYTAAVLSCLVTYVIIGYIGKDSLRNINNKFAKKLFGHLDSHPLRSVVLLRAFFGTAPVLNYAMALSGVTFRNHIKGTMIGLAIPIFLHTVLFDFFAKYLFDIAI
jgi:uncharacterized membrane protein YdjX (TVP38/TMEM64 family)